MLYLNEKMYRNLDFAILYLILYLNVINYLCITLITACVAQ